MSLLLRKHKGGLEIVEGTLPDEQVFRVFTEEEVLQFKGWRQWMADNDWEESKVEDGTATYGKTLHEDKKDTEMNTRLKAHINSGNLILDEPLPRGIEDSQVIISIEQLSDGETAVRPEERAQSESGFARAVLLDPSEDVWDHE